MEWPWRRRVPRAWGEVKRASSCKGVSFSGSVVARSLPGIQLIVAWRVAPMRAAAAHGTRRASGGRGPRYRRGSSIDPRPRFIAAPCHAVLVSCVRSIPLSPSPARVRSSRMEDRDRESIAVSNGPLAQSHFPRLSAGIFLRPQKFISIHWYKILCTCIREDLWI